MPMAHFPLYSKMIRRHLRRRHHVPNGAESARMQLSTCCGCYSLKAGTIFTGILGIVLSIVSLIMIFTLNVEWKTILIDVLDQSIVRIIFAINLCMTILISMLLIIGALKKNTFMMLPWVVLGLILAVGLLVSVVYTSIMFFVNHEVINGALWLVVGFVSVVIYTYLWLVVYSYFQQMRYDKLNNRIDPYGRPYNYRRP
ncbi:uncharacterized protein LOC122395353 isoform X1 [Colletes gigas]|uniref:uncharacterized protein LOC122395353 isoform X1 n=2 Tax=Colletes gigas TaxID=935657 RepID=UPI001C9AE49E|nr:uncharacterized protein LOC122395353 isoform X1 [Colletes gigas]XP_043248778.1 uncharacterized protein LOC122395353 isoform X1 [Colletes gigas]